MTTWVTTIDELMSLFRSALVALVPTMDEAKIAWRDNEAYDDWDAIVDVLYEQVVVASARWSLPESAHATFRMPPYGALLDSYNGLTFVSVTGSQVVAPIAFRASLRRILHSIRCVFARSMKSGDLEVQKLLGCLLHLSDTRFGPSGRRD